MYARLVRFSFGEGKHAEAQALAAEVIPLITSQPGCEHAVAFGDELDGTYGVFVLWDTQDHADSAALIVRPKLDEHLRGNIDGPMEARLFEVLSG